MSDSSNQAARPRSRGFVAAVGLTGVLGVVLVGATLTSGPGELPLMPHSTDVPAAATEEYGKRLITETTLLLGPNAADPEMRYAGNGLNCASCHLAGGTQQGTLTLVSAFERYPRFSARSAKDSDLKARINGCMQRSMNGRKLPEDSVEMQAMVAYLTSLYERNEATGESQRQLDEPPAFQMPDRAANLDAGQQVFEQRCAKCHAPDGLGVHASDDPAMGYVFPPLWGPESFNDGAGMHRVLTASRFIKARMPLGQPDLTDDEVFDVAAYINSKPRPEMANLELDYPDKTAKPVDAGYGPWADSFPAAQHQFGPFRPIQEYYDSLKENER